MTLPRDTKPQKSQPQGLVHSGRHPSPHGKGEKAFDAWLKQGLHKLYDDVTSEPVPDVLLQMIEEDRKK